MRSINLITNDLHELSDQLTLKAEQLIHDASLKKRVRDVSANVGIIGFINHLESSKKIVSDNLSNAKSSINQLTEETTIKSLTEINQLLNMIHTFIIEYEESLKEEEKGESPEALIEKINKINLRAKEFKYTNNLSLGIFSATAENSAQIKADVVSVGKKSPDVKTKHINGVSSQTISSGAPTKKSS